MENGALSNAEAVAWICFILGAIVVLVGLYVGLISAPKKAEEANQEKLEKAKAKVTETAAQLEAATSSNLESGEAADAAAAATEAAKEAKSLLDGIGGLVGSLPEHQRFSGMLVLVGMALMSVATIQFGGTSIF